MTIRPNQSARTFARTGAFASRPQARAGRTYSHMPTVLKELCVSRFARHTARL